MFRDPVLDELDHLLDRIAVATAAEGAHDERLSAVGRGDAKDGLDAVGQRLVALALGAVVLQRVGTDGLGDDQHVGAAHIAPAGEQHLGHVQSPVGEQRSSAVVTVLVVEVALVGYKDRVQVALGAQDLLRAEGAVLVGAAGAGEGAGIHDHRLARGIAVERLGSEGGHDLDRRLRGGRRSCARFSCFLGGLCCLFDDLGRLAGLLIAGLRPLGVRLGHLGSGLRRPSRRGRLGAPQKRAALPFLVDARVLNGLVGLTPEGRLHEARVPRRLAPPLLPLLVPIRTPVIETRHTALLPFK